MAYTSAQVVQTTDSEAPYIVVFRVGTDIIAEMPADSAMAGWTIVRSKLADMCALALEEGLGGKAHKT